MKSKFDFWSEFDRGMEVWLWNWHLLSCRSFHFRLPARDQHWHWEWQHSICIQQQQRCPGTLLVHSGTLVHCWYSPGTLLSNNNTGQWGDKKELSLAIIWQSYMSCIHSTMGLGNSGPHSSLDYSNIMTTNCLPSIPGSVSNYECIRDWSNVSFVRSGLNTNKVLILRLSWYSLLSVNMRHETIKHWEILSHLFRELISHVVGMRGMRDMSGEGGKS